jgi:DNA-binding NarL/FixJ family response regulator
VRISTVSQALPKSLQELTPREREVISLMAEGRTNTGIAKRFFLSDRTVETHVTSILAKLHLPSGEDDHRRVLAVVTYLREALSGKVTDLHPDGVS